MTRAPMIRAFVLSLAVAVPAFVAAPAFAVDLTETAEPAPVFRP